MSYIGLNSQVLYPNNENKPQYFANFWFTFHMSQRLIWVMKFLKLMSVHALLPYFNLILTQES